ncbi:MAG: hypothetical protein K0B10_15615 [Vicingaceae bacterium]|nr:hypothetical protein [Vicingaceae bacterium]
MRTSRIFVISIIFALSVSCEKDNNKPLDEFTLKSTDYNGFLFETLKIIPFPNANNLLPDVLVAPHTIENGDVISPFLLHPDIEERKFFLSAEFENITNALESYESFELPNDYQLQQFAFNVKPFQIWLVKTNSENFGVVLIKNTEYNNNNDSPYAEVTFKAKKIN